MKNNLFTSFQRHGDELVFNGVSGLNLDEGELLIPNFIPGILVDEGNSAIALCPVLTFLIFHGRLLPIWSYE
jgi:hypothetical protein